MVIHSIVYLCFASDKGFIDLLCVRFLRLIRFSSDWVLDIELSERIFNGLGAQ